MPKKNTSDNVLKEAEAQNALLASIFAGEALADWANAVTSLSRGNAAEALSIYTQNAHLNAANALRIALPKAASLVPDALFDQLVIAYYHHAPPMHGLWAHWGAGFAAWFKDNAREDIQAQYPDFADAAKLDWACHQAETAPDADADLASLQGLTGDDAMQRHLLLHPSVQLLNCKMHENTLVYRVGWRAQTQGLSNADYAFTAAVLAGKNIGDALEIAGDGFSFEAWLGIMLPLGLVLGLVV